MKVCFLPFAALLLSLSVAVNAQWCSERVSPVTPDERFSVSGDEVTDLQTGLIWQRCSVGQSWDGTTCSGSATAHSWSEALAMASGDWRLPNIKELTSIVEIGCSRPAVNLTVFPATASFGYWSSSPYADSSDSVWFINFKDGYEQHFDESSGELVRLVRGGQEASGFDN